MLSGKMFDNFFLQIVKINTRKISNSCPFARISTCKEQEREGILKIIFLLCMLTCFCCQDANLFLLLGYSISNLVDEIDYFTWDIQFQISLMKSITLLLKSLVGNCVTFGN